MNIDNPIKKAQLEINKLNEKKKKQEIINMLIGGGDKIEMSIKANIFFNSKKK